MFQPHEFEGKVIGWSFQTENFFAFFGNRNFTRDKFNSAFPKFEFRHLKQVHGCEIIESRSELATADAHYTREINCALVVQTADCQPILYAGKNQVAACHAGWRGVSLQIPGKTARLMAEPYWAAIGPHIQFKNFEVQIDVAEKILSSLPSGPERANFTKAHSQPQKVYVNLAKVSSLQMQTEVPKLNKIEVLSLDTISDPTFHSFRRDGERAERQYSFIVRLDQKLNLGQS